MKRKPKAQSPLHSMYGWLDKLGERNMFALLATGTLLSLMFLTFITIQITSPNTKLASSRSEAFMFGGENPFGALARYWAGSQATSGTVSSCGDIPQNQYRACYYTYSGTDFFKPSNLKLTRLDAAINFDWTSSPASPGPQVPDDYFSATWDGNFSFNAGVYNFSAIVDDGIRVFIDGQKVLDKWLEQGPTTYTFSKTMTAGTHHIQVQYYESWGWAKAVFNWAPASGGGNPVIPNPTGFVPQPCPAIQVEVDDATLAIGQSTNARVDIPAQYYPGNITFSLSSNTNNAVDLSGARITGAHEGSASIGGRAWIRTSDTFCPFTPADVEVSSSNQSSLDVSPSLVYICPEPGHVQEVDVHVSASSAFVPASVHATGIGVGGRLIYLGTRNQEGTGTFKVKLGAGGASTRYDVILYVSGHPDLNKQVIVQVEPICGTPTPGDGDNEGESSISVFPTEVLICNGKGSATFTAYNNGRQRLYMNVNGHISYVDPISQTNPTNSASYTYDFTSPGSITGSLVTMNSEIGSATATARLGTTTECN